MEYVVPLAVKSLLIAAGTLLLLKLMHRRSASDRSWVAHLGLLAILLLPVWIVSMPALQVAGPAFLASDVEAGAPAPARAPAPAIEASDLTHATEVGPRAARFPEQSGSTSSAAVDWALGAYAAPSLVLLLLTLIALGRLTVLKSRANVVVDAHWLQALARAQQRMGFKHGTALLTSDELRSPVSWGLMRPVILLNSDASEAHDQAEAIIAHELAHVAALDWAKLMCSRITVALFWFNPLVWLLAREAHQLREEAADDAVLGADIEDTDYANLLVGIARHECRGMLLGAHGVAPGKGSLTRRVRRVLDAALERAPGGWKWSSAAAFFAAGMTVPLAAIQFVTPTIASAARQERIAGVAPAATRLAPALSAAPAAPISAASAAAVARTDASQGRVLESNSPPARLVLNIADAPSAPRLPEGRNADLRASIRASVATVLSEAGRAVDQAGSGLDRAVALKAIGASPRYVLELKDAGAQLRLTHDEVMGLAATNVTPDYVRDLGQSGLRNLRADDIQQARAMGIDGAYVRGMAAAGYGRLSLDKLTELKAVGVTPGDAARYARANGRRPSVSAIVAAKASGLRPEDIEKHDDR